MAAMLLSVVENNRGRRLRIFVLGDGELADEGQIREMLRGYPADVSFVSFAQYFPDDLVLKAGHVTRSAYARLLMDRVLPDDVDRVIYLDCDTIVTGDLAALWSRDLSGLTVAAVPDASPYTHHAVLGLPAGAPYFNSGVLLVDLGRWRELGIGARALEFARRHPERLQWWDQCALNLTLLDDWVALDATWNFQTGHIASDRDGFVHFRKIADGLRRSIKVVHFSGRSKPWHYLNDHPMKQDYLTYRQRTPWPLERFADRTARSVLRRFAHRRLPVAVRACHAVERILGWG